MLQKAMTAAAIAVMAGTAMGADYMFPTAYPSGVELDTVKQIVTFIWDDNAYSGLARTDYELHPDSTHLLEKPDEGHSDYDNHNWVGGEKPWGAEAPNKMGIDEGQMGMSWAITTLAGRSLPMASYDPKVAYKEGKHAYEIICWVCICVFTESCELLDLY